MTSTPGASLHQKQLHTERRICFPEDHAVSVGTCSLCVRSLMRNQERYVYSNRLLCVDCCWQIAADGGF